MRTRGAQRLHHRARSAIGAIAFVVCAVFGPVFIEAAPKIEPIVVTYHPGGLLAEEQMWVDMLRESKTPVVVLGRCVSACTLLLELPREQLCTMPGAEWGFHMPYDMATHELLYIAGAQMVSQYPRPLQVYFTNHPLGAPLTVLSGQDLIAMGAVRSCRG